MEFGEANASFELLVIGPHRFRKLFGDIHAHGHGIVGDHMQA